MKKVREEGRKKGRKEGSKGKGTEGKKEEIMKGTEEFQKRENLQNINKCSLAKVRELGPAGIRTRTYWLTIYVCSTTPKRAGIHLICSHSSPIKNT